MIREKERSKQKAWLEKRAQFKRVLEVCLGPVGRMGLVDVVVDGVREVAEFGGALALRPRRTMGDVVLRALQLWAR